MHRSTGRKPGFLPLTLCLLFGLTLPAHAQDNAAGKEVFMSGTEPPCALCHTLAAAGAEGEIGPNLDEMKPDEDKVRRAVERGVGNMPPFGEVLSREQIDAVSKFVAEAVKR